MTIIRENILTANQFNMLFNSAGWDSPSEEQIQTALSNSFCTFIKQQLPKGYKVSLELISSKGKESFYSKFGFEKRPCEWDGAGMFMIAEV